MPLLRQESRSHYGSVEEAVVAAFFVWLLVGILRRGGFINIDAEAGLVIRVHVALADDRRTGKDFAHFFVELGFFLNAEVWRGQVKMKVVAVTERIHIGRPVPCGAHIEELATVG